MGRTGDRTFGGFPVRQGKVGTTALTQTSEQARAADPVQEPARSTCVLVLGMHRSGTSALSGVLSMLGCDLPSNTMEASPANAKGFFESTRIRDFNDELLASAGSSWSDFQEFSTDWLNAPPARGFEARAVEVLASEFGASPLIVLKDPRTCRLLPFWLKVLDRAGYDVKPIHIQRNPLEVARSVHSKKGFSKPFGQMLWLRHVLDAEAGTRGMTRFHTSFEQLMQGWENVIARTESALDVTWPRGLDYAEAEIDRFLSSDLRHHLEPPERVIDSPLLADWLRETYKITTRWAEQGENPDDFETLDRIRDEFNTASAKFGRVVRGEREIADMLRRQTEEAQAELRRLEQRQDQAQSERVLELQDKLAQTELRHQQEHDLRLAELESRNASIAELSSSLADAETQIQERFSELAGLTNLIVKHEKKIADLTAERDTLKVKLASERAERDRTYVARDEAQALSAHREQEILALRSSTSWRATRPLRWIIGALRGNRAP